MSNQRTLYQGQFDFGTVSVFSKADIIERRQKRFQQTVQKSFMPSQSYQTSIQLNGDFIDLEGSTIPVFFETTSYQIRFEFDQELVAYQVVHPLLTVENSFQAFEKILQGTVNFQNNIGLFDLDINIHLKGIGWQTIDISFWVYPTKMDLQSDYQVMTDTLIKDDPLGLYDFLSLTKIERSVGHRFQESEVVWYSHFLRLKENLVINLHIIAQSPHYIFIDCPTYIRADRITKRVSNKLMERIVEDLRQDNVSNKYRVDKRLKTFDTIENQFVKYAIESIIQKIDALQSTVLKKITSDVNKKKTVGDVQLQSNFTKKMSVHCEDFHTCLNHPFFRQVTGFRGMTSLSLVFQERTGYAGFYRDWVQFQMMLDMWDDSNAIGIKTIAQIYERWCFLELSRFVAHILQELSEDSQVLSDVGDSRFQHTYRVRIDGEEYSFVLYDNQEYSYSGTNSLIHTLVKDTKQRPDITMEMKRGEDRLFWLFDAKYRIDNHSRRQNETPPKDAFDQMHRYRDALFLKTKEGTKPLPVVGAFVLFPGVLNDDFYASSIEKTGVGAFSMLPKRHASERSQLFRFLQRKLSSLTRKVPLPSSELRKTDFLYITEPNRLPRIPDSYQRLQHQVLVVVPLSMDSRLPAYRKKFASGEADFYHLKCSATSHLSDSYQNIVQRSQYIAVAHIEKERYFLEYVYPIQYVVIQRREEIFIGRSGIDPSAGHPDELYWCVHLDPAIPLPQALEIMPTVGEHIYGISISQLFAQAQTQTDISG